MDLGYQPLYTFSCFANKNRGRKRKEESLSAGNRMHKESRTKRQTNIEKIPFLVLHQEGNIEKKKMGAW